MVDVIASGAQTKWEFSCDLEVDYESERKTHIVYSALAVDEELHPDKVKREMSVTDGKLSVHFEATEARFLRASFSAFVDVLTLATKTIEEFGQWVDPRAETTYKDFQNATQEKLLQTEGTYDSIVRTQNPPRSEDESLMFVRSSYKK